MQTVCSEENVLAFVLKYFLLSYTNPRGKFPSSSREVFGGTEQTEDLRTCFPTWIPLPWALCCSRDVFVQTGGWRRLRGLQRAEASPGYVSAASELEHVVCLMLQQNTSPGKVSLIQLHLERRIFPGVTSSLFQAEVWSTYCGSKSMWCLAFLILVLFPWCCCWI